MTRDEIMALAECELDCALAAAFGWRMVGVDDWGLVEGFAPSGDLKPVPPYSSIWEGIGFVQAEMAQRGYCLTLKSPFAPGQPYFAGFTSHGTTGWNGRPDHEANGATAPQAVARAALLTLLSEAER